MTEDDRAFGERWGAILTRVDGLMEFKKDAARELDKLRTDNATTKQRLNLIWSIMASLALALLGLVLKLLANGGLS